MSIKRFGSMTDDTTSSPFKKTGETSSDSVGGSTVGKNVRVVVDNTLKPSLGSTYVPSRDLAGFNEHKIVPANDSKLLSVESGQMPYETLFNDFDLQVWPHYNFWTADELTNENEELGNRKIDEVPRYVVVSWLTAPDLVPEENRRIPKDAIHRNIEPVKFGLEIENRPAFMSKGVSFSPEHLQPENFSMIVNATSNGHVAPGVVEAVVSLPLHNTGLDSEKTYAKTDGIHQFDEDTFLSDPELDGVSIQELEAQINQTTNGTLAAAIISNDEMSEYARKKKEAMFDGQFAVYKSHESGGKMRMNSVNPSSPSMMIVANTAKRNSEEKPDDVLEIANRITQSSVNSDLESQSFVKVKFIDPAISGIVSEERVNTMDRPEHAENMLVISRMLPNLEVLSQADFFNRKRKIDLPSFPSPDGVKTLEYVGYVLEKYKKQRTGFFKKVEEIHFPNREYDNYIDTKVVYGAVYRYRIKTIIRWTRPVNVGPLGKSSKVVEQNGSHTKKLASKISSYFSSEWNKKWAYAVCIDDQPPAPPDELNVRPESAKNRVCVTFRLPDNTQRDIMSMRLYRKIQTLSGKDVTSWKLVHNHDAIDRKVDFGPQNVLYYDYDVTTNNRYVYAATCFTRHGENSTYSEQLAVRLSADYEVYGEIPVTQISCAGVRQEYFGSFSTRPHKRFNEEIVVPMSHDYTKKSDPSSHASLSGRNAFGNVFMVPSRYTFRFESLDTGETIDIPIRIKYFDKETLEEKKDSSVHISNGKTSRQDAEKKKRMTPTSDDNGSSRDDDKIFKKKDSKRVSFIKR